MNPIFIIVFWLKVVGGDANVAAVSLDSMEFGGYSKNPHACESLPMADILKPLPDAAEKIAAGLVPKVLCAIAAPDQNLAAEAPGQKPPVRSEPGHPDQPQGPSGEL